MEKLCLVTGACGFCGSYMVNLLLERGYKVRATDLEKSERGIHTDIVKKEGVEFIPSDLTKKETLKEVVKDVAYVFHPAAIFSYHQEWEPLYKVNVEGTRNLCEVLVEEGRVEKFINWSTVGVYGLPKPEYLPIREGYTPEPSNIYEKTKYEQEKVVLEFCKKDKLPVIIIRPSPIYGPGNIYGVAQMWLNFAKIPFFIMPKNLPYNMPFVHVKDVCNAALFLAENERRLGQVYNIVDDSNISTYGFFKLFSEVSGKKFITAPDVKNLKVMLAIVKAIVKASVFFLRILSKVIPIPIIIYFRETALYVTAIYGFSNEKLKSLGYKFLYPTVKDGIKETLSWYREKGMMK